MAAPCDVQGTLISAIALRLVRVRRAVRLSATDASARYSRRLAEAALNDVGVLCQALGAPSKGAKATSARVDASVALALRCLEPVVASSGVRVLCESMTTSLSAHINEAVLLRVLIMALHEAIEVVGANGAVSVSITKDGSTVCLYLGVVALVATPVGDAAGAPSAELSAYAARFGVTLARDADTASWVMRLPATAAGDAAPIARLRLSPHHKAAKLAHDDTTGEIAIPRTTTKSADAERVLGVINAHASNALTSFYQQTPLRRVLVVDDESAILGLFAAALPTIGIEFELAESPSVAQSVFRPQQFSIALVDKNMPGQSGLDLIRQLQEQDPHLGAVLMTGYSSAHSVSAALELGIYDYIDKPFSNLTALLARVDLSVRRNALQRRVAQLTESLDGLTRLMPPDVTATDARLQRVRGLLTGSIERPLTMMVLAAPQVVEHLTDALAPPLSASVRVAEHAQALRAAFTGELGPDMIVLDPALWPEALDTLLALCHQNEGAAAQVIAVTQDESMDAAQKAMNAGVTDYILMSESTPEQLHRRIRQAVDRLRQHRRDRQLLLDILTVDIDRLAPPPPPPTATAQDFADFEPQLEEQKREP